MSDIASLLTAIGACTEVLVVLVATPIVYTAVFGRGRCGKSARKALSNFRRPKR